MSEITFFGIISIAIKLNKRHLSQTGAIDADRYMAEINLRTFPQIYRISERDSTAMFNCCGKNRPFDSTKRLIRILD